MAKPLTNNVIVWLIVLLVISIPVGMPLVHVPIHHLHEKKDIEAPHFGRALPEDSEEAEESYCPVCYFLSTCPLHTVGMGSGFTVDSPSGSIPSALQPWLIEIALSRPKPRAPPFFSR